MHRRTPLGLDREPPPPDDIAPYAGAHTPGPITTVTTRSDTGPVAGPSPSSQLPDNSAFNFPFAVADRLYRLRRVDTAWLRAPNEVNVSPDEAVGILEHALTEHHTSVSLVRLLEAAVTKLAGVHEGGVYVLLWLQPVARFDKAATPPPPPKRSAPPIRLSEPPPVEEPSMPLTQAKALKDAAKEGVPFCEECARADAARAAQTA